MPRANKSSVDRVLQQALQHHRAGRFEEAGRLYRRALSLDPGEPTALQNLGLIAMERGRHPFAAELIGKALARRPDDPGIHYNLGLALQKAGRIDDALARYDNAIALSPDFAEAFYNRGNALSETGRLAAAIADYRRVVELQPGFPAAHANLAGALAAAGRARDAAEAYRSALTLVPNAPELHNGLGTVLADLGRLDEAEAAYRQALALDPNHVDAWFNLHAALYSDEAAAAACLESALRIARAHQLSRFFLAVLRDRQGDKAAADAHFAALPADCDFVAFGRDSWDYVKQAGGTTLPQIGETAEGLRLGLAAARVAGLVLEFGVRHGTTIGQIAATAAQEVHGFDTFTGLPEDWHEHRAGTYSTEGELPPVPANVRLHSGLFADTLPGFLETHPGPVRFANIDCDLYSATETVLTLLAPRIVAGTVLVFDEYLFTAHWREDEFRAFQEAVATFGWRYDYLALSLLSKQAVVIIR